MKQSSIVCSKEKMHCKKQLPITFLPPEKYDAAISAIVRAHDVLADTCFYMTENGLKKRDWDKFRKGSEDASRIHRKTK